VASVVSDVTSALGHLSGWVAIVLIAALVFGETAIFLGFVLPGEAAVVFGGVLASRGHLSLPVLIGVVVVTAVAGPLVGYEVSKRMGDRLFTSRRLSRVSGALSTRPGPRCGRRAGWPFWAGVSSPSSAP